MRGADPAYVNDQAIRGWLSTEIRPRRRCSLVTDYAPGAQPPGVERRACELCELDVWYTTAQQPGPEGEVIYCRVCADIWAILCEQAGRPVRRMPEPETAELTVPL